LGGKDFNNHLVNHIPALMVFLSMATITKHAEALSVLERSIQAWHDLTKFFATIHRGDEQAYAIQFFDMDVDALTAHSC
jgi:hypothetical protein